MNILNASTAKHNGKTIDVEEFLCLVEFVRTGALPGNATEKQARAKYDSFDDGCNSCPYEKTCVVTVLNR